MKMMLIRRAATIEEMIRMLLLMISKNNKGEEVKAMIFPCVDDARFNQKKKEKKKTGKER